MLETVTAHLFLPPLQNLCDSLMQYLTTEAQVKLYRSTVVTLLHFPTPSMKSSSTAQVWSFMHNLTSPLNCLLCTHQQMLDAFDAKTKHSTGAVVPAIVAYMAEYSEEMKLNEEFNRFVANFQLAYQGPNTAHAQIGAKYTTGRLRQG